MRVKIEIDEHMGIKDRKTVRKYLNLSIEQLIGEVPNLPVLDHFGAFKYESSDEKIAKVSESGKVTGVSKGNCKIRITACNGISRTIQVTVKPKLKEIYFPETEYELKKGKTLDLSKKLKREPASATAKFEWTSSNNKIATVDKKGVITGIRKGEVTITVTVKGNKKLNAEVTIKVTKKSKKK